MNRISQIKDKLRKIKSKYGMATALTGFMAVGSLNNNNVKPDNTNIQNTEQLSTLSEKIKDQNICDGTLMSILIMLEGCTLKAYTDDIGVWTYGIGCTKTMDGKSVKKGDTLKDNDEAFDVANHHIKERIDWVFDYIERDLKPEQKAALKSFAYNCGAGTLVQDGKLTKLGEAVNNGDDDFVIREILTYNKAGGSFMRGLFFRRVLEAYVYQNLISLDDLQKCIIGGIGNVSLNEEMCDIFKLKMSDKKGKRGRKSKVKATFDDSEITNGSVATKMVAICQTPIKGAISAKYADFHTGELVSEFLPKTLDITKDYQWQSKNLASMTPYLGKIVDGIKNKISSNEK